jgi:hypothetical protein
MATQEGIELIIKAQDQYSGTLNKIKASNDLFGKSVENIQKQIGALQTYMVKLVTAGVDPASKGIQRLQGQLKGLNQDLLQVQNAAKGAGNAIGGAAGGLKDSNKQWSALSLIVQDLPFGFRGIQNNLPALFGTMASGTGAAYFGFSALVAAITAFDMGMFGATKTTNDFGKALKETNKEIKDTLNYTNGQISNLQGLVDVMLDVNSTESIRNKALAEAKQAISEVDEAQGKKIKTIGDAIVAINLYTEAIQQQQMQEVIGKRIAEITIGQIERRNTLAIETNKANRGVHPINWFMGNTELQGLQTEIIANETLLRQLEDLRKGNTKALLLNPFSKYNASKPNNKGESEEKARLKQTRDFNLQVLQDTVNAKKLELKLYEDDAYKKYQVAEQLAMAERQLSLKKIEYSEYDEKQKAILSEAVYKEYADQILLLSQSMQEQLLVQDAKTRKEKKNRDKQDYAEQEKFGKNQVDLIDSQLKVGLRLNRDNVIGQQELIKESMAKVGVMMAASFGTGQFPVLLKYYDELNAKLLGLDTAALRGADAMKQVNSIISDTATNAIVQFGENLGKALGGEKVDLFGGFIELLSNGLQSIGKALIAYGAAMDAFKKAFSNPYAAIAAGVALVAIGVGLKTAISQTSGENTGVQKFAKGGIISGPTMGLMGEYPGASSNPEVVAPLDKLKDMIGGGGGGTFVLRGQDLLLSVNRAQKASNIKGQNINLA